MHACEALSRAGDRAGGPALGVIDVVSDTGAKIAELRMTKQQRTRPPEQEMQTLHTQIEQLDQFLVVRLVLAVDEFEQLNVNRQRRRPPTYQRRNIADVRVEELLTDLVDTTQVAGVAV